MENFNDTFYSLKDIVLCQKENRYGRYNKWLEEVEEVKMAVENIEEDKYLIMELIDVISTSLSFIQVLNKDLLAEDILKLLDIKISKWKQEVDREKLIESVLNKKKETIIKPDLRNHEHKLPELDHKLDITCGRGYISHGVPKEAKEYLLDPTD